MGLNPIFDKTNFQIFQIFCENFYFGSIKYNQFYKIIILTFFSSFSERLLLNNFNLKAIVLFPQIFRNRIFLVFFSENRIAFRLIFYQKESWIVAFHKHFLLFSWNSPSQKLSHFLTFSISYQKISYQKII